jgi:hypothetical protein
MVRKIILFATIAVALSGCYTQKQCKKFCDSNTTTNIIIKDSIIEKYKDTTVYVKLLPDTVYNVDTIKIVKNKVINLPKSKLENKFCFSYAYVLNNRLYHNLITKDTTLEFRLDNAVKELYHIKTLHEEVVKMMETDYTKSIDRRDKIILFLLIITLILLELKFKLISRIYGYFKTIKI